MFTTPVVLTLSSLAQARDLHPEEPPVHVSNTCAAIVFVAFGLGMIVYGHFKDDEDEIKC